MSEKEQILGVLKKIADSIANTFPNAMEVVLHDLYNLNNSIVYIKGEVTNREINGPATDLVVRLLYKYGNNVKDQYNYKSISKDGREIKSTTSFFRNNNNEVVAALCINFDMTSFLNALKVLEAFTKTNEIKNEKLKESFTRDINETIDALFEEAVDAVGKQPATMTVQERVTLVKELQNLGVFQIKGGVEHVGSRMGVTKYTIYNYLRNNKINNNVNKIN